MIPQYDDEMDDCSGEDMDEEAERQEKCQCPFCHCSVRCSTGICDMCSEGAHQG